ncbi:hypothetical protein P7M42_16885, partial [Vibrio parahaemolyticus]|nr:hypothetical protein [Vibrio parahaemolyticus]
NSVYCLIIAQFRAVWFSVRITQQSRIADSSTSIVDIVTQAQQSLAMLSQQTQRLDQQVSQFRV